MFISFVNFFLSVLNTWNFYLLVISLFSFMACILYSFQPESPKYLVTQNRLDEARETLIKVYLTNSGKLVETFEVRNKIRLEILLIVTNQASWNVQNLIKRELESKSTYVSSSSSHLWTLEIFIHILTTIIKYSKKPLILLIVAWPKSKIKKGNAYIFMLYKRSQLKLTSQQAEVKINGS